MEGVVAGVPVARRLRRDHRRRRDGSDPENAVPFSIKTEDGREFKQPGNFFALVETSAFGTEPKFVAKGVEPDLDGDGKVTFPEALPDARLPARRHRPSSSSTRKELDAAAKKWEPTLEDAFTAVVVMTPTMSEYFDAWKNSRFIAGNEADEKGFVATSRLSDIRDILGGLVLIYDTIKPASRRSTAAGRPDASAAQGAAPVRRAPLQRGAGRQAVHGRGSRHARLRGAAQRRGDRRARCRSRPGS